ncbi:MAG: hypothetical protein WAO95_08780 [Burkholderiales bacterium]
MKTLLVVAGIALPLLVLGQSDKINKKANEDIAAHRAIAAAHERAARCLESGKPEKECHAHLATECKAIAIGKYCGMKHRH